QDLFRIEERDLDVEDVGKGLRELAAAALLAAIEQLLAGLRRLVLDETCREELLREAFEVLEREPFRPKALLVFLLRLVEGAAAVHVLDQEVLLFLETVVTQTHRILDDVVSPPLVLLRRDRQIAAQSQADSFASFQVSCGGGGGHSL